MGCAGEAVVIRPRSGIHRVAGAEGGIPYIGQMPCVCLVISLSVSHRSIGCGISRSRWCHSTTR